MKNLIYQIDHLKNENNEKFWQFAGAVVIEGRFFEVDLTSNQPQNPEEITVLDENGNIWIPDITPFGYLDDYNVVHKLELNEKEDTTNALSEWLEEADDLARQTGIAFGFGVVKNWDDARREASLLSEDPDPDLARAGIELLEMIPS